MTSLKEPLSRVLINQKLTSQRSAKNFIRNNEVLINGMRIFEASFPVDSEKDEVIVNSKKLSPVIHQTLMLNKPRGVVCSTVSDSHCTVYDLLKRKIDGPDLFKFKCAGRLDCDTSGLLILSTNGTLVKVLTDPQNNVEKKYYVKLRDAVSDKKLYSEKIAAGIEIPPEKKSTGFTSRSAKLEWISCDEVFITVTEGKFHEVRRIFAALNNQVMELKRIQMGDFFLDENLREGEFKLCQN